MNFSKYMAAGCIGVLLSLGQSFAQPIVDYSSRHHPVVAAAQDGMVVAQDKLAAEVGARILARGGNAVDAAVATGFALAVTFPQAGNIGGGGFMLLYLSAEDRVIALDYREMAPGYAHRDLFLDENGTPDASLSRSSIYASGIPGTVAGFVHAQQNYGKLSLAEVMEPAIELAEQGFIVGHSLAYSLDRATRRLSSDEAAKEYYFKPDGSPYFAGERLVQSDLAETLRLVSDQGTDGFYRGEVAQMMIAEWDRHGAVLTQDDLDRYRVVERAAIRGAFQGYEIASMPPPSSGGVHLVQMLNILSNFDLGEAEQGSAEQIHLLVEAMKYAYADRSRYLGDPDFVDVPIGALLDQGYASRIAGNIVSDVATDSSQIAPGVDIPVESNETTHFSVWDGEGNVVSNTYTLNFSYGSGIAVAGAGFLLNNEMDDFSAAAGVPNAYGLLGDEANAVEAYKRPLSSMTPTIVFQNDAPIMATGSPGGSAIITIVLQVVLNVLAYDMNIADAVAAPRIHHQWFPDSIRWEPGVGVDTRNRLQNMGHQLDSSPRVWGKAESIYASGDWLYGASDPRWPDSGAVSLPAEEAD